jgi:S1-C subfamily serine protease
MQALYELRNGLRQKVGDPTFDCLLYASQRPNRVVVRSLLASGPAARAGMRAGDAIVSYDESRIFRANELQRGTSQGEAGRPVAVEIVSSDGRSRQLMIPSGPLGVSLGEERRPPRTCR